MHSREAQVADEISRNILVEAAFCGVSTLVGIKRVVTLITHRLATVEGQDILTRGNLFLLASVVQRASSALSSADFAELKQAIFVRSEVVKLSLVSESNSIPIRAGMYCDYFSI